MRRAKAITMLLAAAGLAGAVQARSGAGTRCGAACPTFVGYVGGRVEGAADGITAFRLDPSSGALSSMGVVAHVMRPTWLLASPDQRVIFSVSEAGNDGLSEGAALSFSADAGSGALRRLSEVPSGGGGSTHLHLVAKAPRALLVANYGGGSTSVIPASADGVLSAATSVLAETGSGPHPRQKSAHAHGVILDPSGRYALTADLGADRIFVYRYDAAHRTIAATGRTSIATKRGSGPRHLAFSPNGRFLYVNSELTGELTSYRWNAATGMLVTVSTITTLPAGFQGERSAGELWASPDGRHVYVSNRGEDTIVVYAADARTGMLREIQRIASGGRQPWSFTLDPSGRWFVVANETSDRLNVFRYDRATGRLAATGQALSVPHPSSIAFLQR